MFEADIIHEVRYKHLMLGLIFASCYESLIHSIAAPPVFYVPQNKILKGFLMWICQSNSRITCGASLVLHTDKGVTSMLFSE